MNIYDFESYSAALAALTLQNKERTGITLSSLALACGMQPSYLTNVIKERADLNSDQLYRLCDSLKLTQGESEFLGLLLEFKKTQFAKRKHELEVKITKIRSQKNRAENSISVPVSKLTPEQAERYYLDPYNQLIHIYLTIPNLKKTVNDIAAYFSVGAARALESLKVLEEIQYIRKNGSSYEIISRGQHLPRDSFMLKPHQQLLRLKSLEQIQALPQEKSYCFSATISTSPKVRDQLQSEFLKYLKRAESLVKNSKPEDVYQINFDLFSWSKIR